MNITFELHMYGNVLNLGKQRDRNDLLGVGEISSCASHKVKSN